MNQDPLVSFGFMIGMGLLLGIGGYFIGMDSLRNRLLFILSLIGGVVFTILGIFLLANFRSTEEMPITTGMVQARYPDPQDAGYTEFSVEYVINNQPYAMTGSLRDDAAQGYRVGDDITVYYMPLLPQWAVLIYPLNRDFAFFVLAAGIGLMIMGGIPTLVPRRN